MSRASSGTARASGRPTNCCANPPRASPRTPSSPRLESGSARRSPDGPRSAGDILREASEAGIGRNVLYAARKLEGVSIGKERVAGGRWVWSSVAAKGEHPDVSNTREVREVREVRSDDQ